ncbi:Transcriptional regulator, AsnC family OS=Tsukamurella paurometabola (strain ATCC 8368 / DSM/ CCUG 35730 / CIP 100753 / JCM 10117 / KCTC 9821 / NBRC 16120/ NCIMB 702349 / NCTC 13040) OX=521096 GN=Tpau_1744 PE=4 SV=1 [Tsukamurella paurometabola]|uniref:Transcriptional regulator, AsnC family n=1 Tax=Tsukamurella paurometabola (strain ATCC 8368 / DSM 20162 / CCUG 35730 / CIP 100753 / JCM 10117 / KCTC 9821 / NBRC 16120 / NCIMB 702349 / NCTC 13040) TaxID=521096 RepID=D5UM82_TSUPD|nr:Lrp/AsnC family transcriptional regulator [Tsukamurella paurometabola]ADG78362.1 transcriptional regulator, AsnC family [Tsukamurella paurometabola DSM 20162]SUP31351.1 Leucine-responsive regulatory protein [Tsukamurella paurometabola]
MGVEDSQNSAYRPPLPNDRRPLLDEVDRRILLVLQRDGRVANATLADEVGLAPSTVHTRVRRLVDAGVIRGFYADVDPAAVGRPLRAMISVRLRSTARHRIRQFVESVIDLPPVIDAYFLAGGDDYVLHVAAIDTDDLRHLVEHLSAREEIAGTNTSLVFEHVRGSAPL